MKNLFYVFKNLLSNVLNRATEPVLTELVSIFPNVIIQQGGIISQDTAIGEYTYIGFNTTITKAFIGRYCSIANNVSIGDGEHIIDKISTNSIFYDEPYGILTKGECIIGNDVWIGTKSIIRRGVKIGNGAIIGANSFVNKDVPAYGIVVGSPAKLLRYRFNEQCMSIINNSNWWELNLEDARRRISILEDQVKSNIVENGS